MGIAGAVSDFCSEEGEVASKASLQFFASLFFLPPPMPRGWGANFYTGVPQILLKQSGANKSWECKAQRRGGGTASLP